MPFTLRIQVIRLKETRNQTFLEVFANFPELPEEADPICITQTELGTLCAVKCITRLQEEKKIQDKNPCRKCL